MSETKAPYKLKRPRQEPAESPADADNYTFCPFARAAFVALTGAPPLPGQDACAPKNCGMRAVCGHPPGDELIERSIAHHSHPIDQCPNGHSIIEEITGPEDTERIFICMECDAEWSAPLEIVEAAPLNFGEQQDAPQDTPPWGQG